MIKTTKHTCGGPVFGKRTSGCPRCDELAAGAAPVKWNTSRREDDANRVAAYRHHVASGECRRTCGGMCVRGDW